MTKILNALLSLIVLLLWTTIPCSAQAKESECGLWLGPSSIKEQEEHGWGHSMFTGKLIKKGQAVLSTGVLDEEMNEKIFGDLMIPLYDWEALDMGPPERENDDDFVVQKKEAELQGKEEPTMPRGEHQDSPLFQQLWNGDFYHLQVLESYESMRIFVPGLANIAPCTSDNFNLEQVQTVTYRDWRNIQGESHDETPPPVFVEPSDSSGGLSRHPVRPDAGDAEPGDLRLLGRVHGRERQGATGRYVPRPVGHRARPARAAAYAHRLRAHQRPQGARLPE